MTTTGRLSRLRNARGMTLIELCVVMVIIGILLVVAVASLLRARVAANETAAIGALKTINTAQVAYSSGCGGGNYASNLIVLGHKPPGINTQGFVQEDLGAAVSPILSGYQFNVSQGAGAAVTQNDCNNTPTISNYYAQGIPAALGRTGTRAFATTQRNGIFQSYGGVPPPEPFGPPSLPAQ